MEPFLKRIFAQKKQVKTTPRVYLDDCKIFLRLKPYIKSEILDDDDLLQKQPPDDVWAYIGYINRSTWHFSVLRMYEAHVETWEPVNVPEGTVLLSIPDTNMTKKCLLTDIELFRGALDFEFSYRMSFFSLVESEGSWDPTNCSCELVPVCPCPSADEIVVWNGAESMDPEPNRKKRAQPSRQHGLTEDQLLRQLQNPPAKRSRQHLRQRDAPEPPHAEPHEHDDPLEDADDAVESGEDVYWNKDQQSSNELSDSSLVLGNEQEAAFDNSEWSPSETDDDDDDDDENLGKDIAGNTVGTGLQPAASVTPAAEETSGLASAESVDSRRHVNLLKRFLESTAVTDTSANASNVPEQSSAPASGSRDVENSVVEASAKARASSTRDRSSTESLVVPGCGNIRFLPTLNVLVAVCDHPGHGDCRRQKTLMPSEAKTNRGKGQGRPIGFLCAWLREQCDHDERTDHIRFNPSYQQRLEARQWLMTNAAGAADFSETHERPLRDGEDSEPKVI